MILTDKQKDELHRSIYVYLDGHQLSSTAETFKAESEMTDADVSDPKYDGLLEKKWTSVVRLQKKVLDLEAKVGSLQEELDSATPLARKIQDPSTWLPRVARYNLTSHRLPITSVAFHPVFTTLASGSEDATIKIWDWELGEFEATCKGHTKAVLDVDFGGPPNGVLLLSGSSDLSIKIWDPSIGYKNIRTLMGHDHSVSSVRFIPPGTHFASVSRDKTVRIWELSSGYCIRTLTGHSDWIRSLDPSNDGSVLITTSNDRSARIWDLRKGEQRLVVQAHDHVVECCAFAPYPAYQYLVLLAGLRKVPNGPAEFFATGSRDKTVKVWDVRGNLIKVLVGHDNWIRAVCFHPSGKYLLSASDDKSVRCWDLTQDLRCIKIIEAAHSHFISCLRWAPSANTSGAVNGDATNGGEQKVRCAIATGSVDRSVKIWMG